MLNCEEQETWVLYIDLCWPVDGLLGSPMCITFPVIFKCEHLSITSDCIFEALNLLMWTQPVSGISASHWRTWQAASIISVRTLSFIQMSLKSTDLWDLYSSTLPWSFFLAATHWSSVDLPSSCNFWIFSWWLSLVFLALIFAGNRSFAVSGAASLEFSLSFLRLALACNRSIGVIRSSYMRIWWLTWFLSGSVTRPLNSELLALWFPFIFPNRLYLSSGSWSTFSTNRLVACLLSSDWVGSR